MKKYFSRTPFTKDKVALRELSFAHTIIVLLSLSLLAVVNILPEDVRLDNALLMLLLDVLLVLTALISLLIVVALTRSNKR